VQFGVVMHCGFALLILVWLGAVMHCAFSVVVRRGSVLPPALLILAVCALLGGLMGVVGNWATGDGSSGGGGRWCRWDGVIGVGMASVVERVVVVVIVFRFRCVCVGGEVVVICGVGLWWCVVAVIFDLIQFVILMLCLTLLTSMVKRLGGSC
jgi:hypothetical protein